jgi:hypothetical protein
MVVIGRNTQQTGSEKSLRFSSASLLDKFCKMLFALAPLRRAEFWLRRPFRRQPEEKGGWLRCL